MTSFVKQEFEHPKRGEKAKNLGAFYTDAQVAEFLVWWAVRSPHDMVMDPSFGGGVFLRAACDRLSELGGESVKQVFGVEIDANIYALVANKIVRECQVNKQNLFLLDFFELESKTFQQVDVIVGNPPFIRYQRFSGEIRKRALYRAAEQGVRLSELTSSWAPFLVHCIAMLKQGGRLAMVIPIEVGHAAYARPVLDHLSKSFGRVTFVTFQQKLFPELSENTLLLLAENKGSQVSQFLWRDVPDLNLLADIKRLNSLPLLATSPINAQGISQGNERLIEYIIPRQARDLYRELRSLSLVKRLGELADVGIGYVTGANDFFHLAPDQAQFWEIPATFLRPAVRRSRALLGLRLTVEDWRQALKDGASGYLLHVDVQTDLPKSIRRYLAYGEQQGVTNTYKCRTRLPWYRVPHVYMPDALLSYMSGAMPRLVANDAGVVATNSLHVLRLHPETHLTGDKLAALWQTSLTRLSVEIEGHALGGGMLKLEPTEAEKVIIAVPPMLNDMSSVLTEELDSLIRSEDRRGAQAYADRVILKQYLGLSQSDCDLLNMAAEMLCDRRYR